MTSEMLTSDEVQTLVEKLVAEHDCPGAAAAIGKGDSLAEGAAGVLNLNTRVEVTTDSLFQIGSNTKVYNATLMMQLVDEGLVDLDELAIKYLPDFKLADKDALQQITVRHLLTHTSGIDGGDYIEDFGRGDDALEKYVASLAEIGLIHPVGKFWSYCNAATVVAGRIIEVQTGTFWRQALKSRLLDPLGLDHTVATPEEAILFRASAGHLPDPANNDEARVFPNWMLPFGTAPAGATINASASDVVEFGRFHLRDGVAADGKRVLSEASARAMREPQFPDVTSTPLGVAGIGWRIAKQGPFTMAVHGGGTLGQTSQFFILPEHDVSVAILTNGPGGAKVIAGVTKELFARLPGGAEFAAEVAAKEAAAASSDSPAAAAPEVDIDLSNYAGVYERNGLRTTVRVEDGGLVSHTEMFGYVAQLPPQKPIKLKPTSPTSFVALDPEGQPVGQATFEELDEAGLPTYFILGRVSRRVS